MVDVAEGVGRKKGEKGEGGRDEIKGRCWCNNWGRRKKTGGKVKGWRMNFCWSTVLSEVECDVVEDCKGSETILKGFATKSSIYEMASLQ